MHAFLSNLANRQTDKQTDKHGQKQLPLSEVMELILTVRMNATYAKYVVRFSVINALLSGIG